MRTVGIAQSTALYLSLICFTVAMVLCPVIGMVSDRIGRRPVALATVGWAFLTSSRLLAYEQLIYTRNTLRYSNNGGSIVVWVEYRADRFCGNVSGKSWPTQVARSRTTFLRCCLEVQRHS